MEYKEIAGHLVPRVIKMGLCLFARGPAGKKAGRWEDSVPSRLYSAENNELTRTWRAGSVVQHVAQLQSRMALHNHIWINSWTNGKELREQEKQGYSTAVRIL